VKSKGAKVIQPEEINRIAINEYRQELLIQKRFLFGNGNLINSFIIFIFFFLSNAVALGLAIGFNFVFRYFSFSNKAFVKLSYYSFSRC
jgi:hypothetical protein